ncbi:MAG: hypothetical protein H0X43_10225 [Nitrosospira sp.]|nr:hypothetical protein [Nitrosospira sp.]
MRLPLFAPLMFLISLDTSAESRPDTESYGQCVLESMKGITSDRAEANTLRACREKFAEERLTDTELPADALDKLIVHAGFGWGIFSGSLYNGNSDYTITRITVLLTSMGNGKGPKAFADGSKHDINLTVQPLAKGALSMPVSSDNTLEYLWKIASARGYKTR